MEKLKKYLTPRLYFAVGIYLVTLAAVYTVQYPMYSGAVSTVFYYILIYPPLFLVAYLGTGKRRKRREMKNESRRIKAMGVIATALFVGCAYVAYHIISVNDHQRLASWQIISIVIGLAIVIVFERGLAERTYEKNGISGKNKAVGNDSSAGLEIAHFQVRVNYLSIVLSLLLVTTVLFLLIAWPRTISDARKILEEGGRANITFVEHYPPEEETLPDGAGSMGAYVFSDVDGSHIYIDVLSGEILN